VRTILQIMKDVISIHQCFEHIKITDSTNAKKKLLKQYADVPMFKETLQFLLDPAITTGLDKKKLKKKVAVYRTVPTTLAEVLDYILANNTGRDMDISYIQSVMSVCGGLSDFLADIITKSYRLGITAKTANAVYGDDFISLWQVQQAYPYEKYPLKSNEWFSVSQKLNGFHASFYKGKLISRQGKEITGCQHILDEIENTYSAMRLKDMFIDGELIRINNDSLSDEENFRLTASIANSDSDDKSQLKFVFYDMIPVSNFDTDQNILSYRYRLIAMQAINDWLVNFPSPYFEMVPVFYSGTDQLEIVKWLKYADENDMEGLIINRDTRYQRKRNSGVLKVKSWKHADLRVIGIEEGDGKYSGSCGKLIVDYKGNPLGLSGMSDEERDAWWSDPDSIIGQIVLVKYKQETQDKTGKKSLQFATYKGIRTDKDEVSYN